MFTCTVIAGVLFWHVVHDQHVGVEISGPQYEILAPVEDTAVIRRSDHREDNTGSYTIYMQTDVTFYTVYLSREYYPQLELDEVCRAGAG